MDPPASTEPSVLSSAPAVIPVIPPPASQSVAPPAASIVQEVVDQKVDIAIGEPVAEPVSESNQEPAEGYSPNGQTWRPLVDTVTDDPRFIGRPRFQSTLVWAGLTKKTTNLMLRLRI